MRPRDIGQSPYTYYGLGLGGDGGPLDLLKDIAFTCLIIMRVFPAGDILSIIMKHIPCIIALLCTLGPSKTIRHTYAITLLDFGFKSTPFVEYVAEVYLIYIIFTFYRNIQ